jgi:hypothetical protein
MLGMSMMMGSRQVYDITLSSNRSQWKKSVDRPDIPSNVPVLLILRISSNVEIQSDLTSTAAIAVDELAPGSEFFLFNSGYILGDGGDAGDGGVGGSAGDAGEDGGNAIRLDFTGYAEIMNSNGRIWAGGGGGGGGGGCLSWNSIDNVYDPHRGGGGGGGGAGGGVRGDGGTDANNGTVGTTGSAGTAGTGGNDGDSNNAGNGGDGGGYGADGDDGAPGTRHGGSSDVTLTNGGQGGAAGYAIRHNAGTVVNFVAGEVSPNVKGAVGSA